MEGQGTKADTDQWELRFRSEPVKVRQIVREIMKFLDEKLPGQSQEERGDFKLIFNELLYNAVIHGNQSDNSKYVHVSLQVKDRRVRAVITDEGPGYDYQKVMAQARGEENLHKETGRGMKLVFALADEVSFHLKGRRIMFTKKIGAGHGW